MAALATPADVAAELGRSLTDAETSRVDSLLDRASAYVRAETGRRYQAGAHTVRRHARGGRIVLDDAASVQAVRAVYDDGSTSVLAEYTLRGSALYGLDLSCWVEVDYTATGTVPDEIRGVTAALVARMLTSPQAGLSARQAGPLMEQYRTVSDTATEADRVVLQAHRLYLGSTVLL